MFANPTECLIFWCSKSTVLILVHDNDTYIKPPVVCNSCYTSFIIMFLTI